MAKFKGGFGGGMPNMNNLMKQAQKMQEEMQKEQENLQAREFIGKSAGGAVEITLGGDKFMKIAKISEDVLDDAEMLGDLILVAFNDAMKQLKYEEENGMGKITGGFNF